MKGKVQDAKVVKKVNVQDSIAVVKGKFPDAKAVMNAKVQDAIAVMKGNKFMIQKL